jgi:hypothetical protein
VTHAKLHARQRKLVEATHAEFDRVARDIRMDGLPRAVGDEERNLIVAQNTLRTALEACFERMLPYSAATPVDLGVRLASYCLSALPVEAQDRAIDALCQVLRDAHPQRLAQGIRLSTTWDTPGQGERDNFPTTQ